MKKGRFVTEAKTTGLPYNLVQASAEIQAQIYSLTRHA